MRWTLLPPVAISLCWIYPTLSPGWASSDEQQPTVSELKTQLRATYPDKRRRAVKKLAALGTEDAWELVIGALADREPEVADEAQVWIAKIDGSKLRKKLLGREGLGAKDDWVRLRVAEALGRMEGRVEGEPLVRAAGAADEAVARALLWSLERLVKRGVLAGDRGKLARRLECCLARPRGARVRAAGLSAIACLDPVLGEARAAELRGDREAEVRSAALAVLFVLRGWNALPAAAAGAGDENARVRLAAVRILRAIGSKGALEVLTGRLETEPRARVKRRVVEALQARTGMRHRLDPRPWRRFLQDLPEDWAPRAEAETTQGAHPAQEARSSVTLAGLPLLSDRVCVLVDFSGSLWNERPSGRTRKELLDEQVRGLLEHLPEEVEFNLVPYTARPVPWRERIERATPRARKDAMRTFERCRVTGTGNFFDAATFALADPRVDTVLVVTDGAPTGGRRWNLELMIELLLEDTRYSHVAFDAVLVDAPKRLQKSWQRLADGSGGRMLAVEFDDLDGKSQGREARSVPPGPPADYTSRR